MKFSPSLRFHPTLFLPLYISSIHIATAEPSSAPYTLQPNAVICSSFFGSPVADDCKRALSTFDSNNDNTPQLFLFATDPDPNPHSILPTSNTVGNCTVDIDIRPGARNTVAWRTISDLANRISDTCAGTAGAPGGWGIYANIYILISSSTSTSQTQLNENTAHNNAFTWSVPSPSTTSSTAPAPTGNGETGELVLDDYAFFRGSFWASAFGQINITDLPGFKETVPWQFPVSVYSPYTDEERGFCPNAPVRCEGDEECCEKAACVDRAMAAPDMVGKVCVPYAGRGNKGSTVTTEGDTVLISAINRRSIGRGKVGRRVGKGEAWE
ncbi:MAG: hypothetical protein Q9166_001148 [cf. Caloplaca sp. 2 TL-2023]